jgi:hypothetical protein
VKHDPRRPYWPLRLPPPGRPSARPRPSGGGAAVAVLERAPAHIRRPRREPDPLVRLVTWFLGIVAGALRRAA